MILAGLTLLAAAGCSTVESRRADPPTFETTTARSLGELQTCLSTGFDQRHTLPSFRPTADGGSYVLAAQGYVQWVIDIHDSGGRRAVVVHAITTLGGTDRKLIAMVQGCAG